MTVKVTCRPRWAWGCSTVLVSARSACCGVSVALALLLAGLGSNWSESVIVAVLVCGRGCDRRLNRKRLRRPDADRADGPDAGRGVVGPLARCRRHERQRRPAAGRSPEHWWRRRGRCWSA